MPRSGALRRRLHGRSWRGCRDLSAAGQALAWILLARYPAAFQAEPTAVRPLKIGIDRDIQQALHADPTVLRAVLRGYTRRRAYCVALAAPGAIRVDLDGDPIEPVMPAHQQGAQQGARARARARLPRPPARRGRPLRNGRSSRAIWGCTPGNISAAR